MTPRWFSFTLIFFLFQAFTASIINASESSGLEVVLSIDSTNQDLLRYSKSLTGTNADQVKLIQQRRITQALPKQRAPFLTEDRLVVVAFDTKGKEISRHYVNDPRWLRSELPNARGQLSKLTLKQTQGQFPVLLPDDGVAQLKIFEPVWKGGNFDLQLIGTVSLADSAQEKGSVK